jgi:hypothetical protein
VSLVDVQYFRVSPAAGLSRYRVGNFQLVTVEENFAMTVRSGFMVAGLLDLRGLLIVEIRS